MADDVTLEAIFDQTEMLREEQRVMREEMSELTRRFGAMEQHLMLRLAELTERLERIERRLAGSTWA